MPKTEAPELPPGCVICNGAPHVATERGAARCRCERGKALAAMDRERRHSKLKSAKKQPKRDGKAAAIGSEA